MIVIMIRKMNNDNDNQPVTECISRTHAQKYNSNKIGEHGRGKEFHLNQLRTMTGQLVVASGVQKVEEEELDVED